MYFYFLEDFFVLNEKKNNKTKHIPVDQKKLVLYKV